MRIEEGSAKPFVERMVNSKHLAMCEHGTVYLTIEYHPDFATNADIVKRYQGNKYSRVNLTEGCAYVTTNYRVIVENGWYDDLDFMREPTEWHEKRVTVRFTTQIAVSREANRHRANSIAEQSTRYCNYSKDKFDNEISVNLPQFVAALPQGDLSERTEAGTVDLTGAALMELARKVATGEASDIENWLFANAAAEKAYMNLVAAGRKPQEARVVLPLDTNTELVHTAFVTDWKHFFDLRALGTTGAPHPDAKALAQPLYERFVEEGWIAPGK